MKKENILALIKGLAMSQGRYGRLLCTIEEEPDILDFLEHMNFPDEIALINYLEC